MAKTFKLSMDDLTALMTVLPMPPGVRRRRGFSYDGSTLTIEDDGEAARVAGLMGNRQWISQAMTTRLKGYAAVARFNREVAGIVVNGVPVGTSREDQAKIAAAQLMAAANPQMVFHWKKPDGSFVHLTAKQVVSIGEAVAAHVQACFAAEDSIGTAINAAASMSEAQIDAAFAAIKV
jgi:Domain of unknown function (DUF4376)